MSGSLAFAGSMTLAFAEFTAVFGAARWGSASSALTFDGELLSGVDKRFDDHVARSAFLN